MQKNRENRKKNDDMNDAIEITDDMMERDGRRTIIDRGSHEGYYKSR
jgi:hypothetical protein